jgi:hypothetical protein
VVHQTHDRTSWKSARHSCSAKCPAYSRSCGRTTSTSTTPPLAMDRLDMRMAPWLIIAPTSSAMYLQMMTRIEASSWMGCRLSACMQLTASQNYRAGCSHRGRERPALGSSVVLTTCSRSHATHRAPLSYIYPDSRGSRQTDVLWSTRREVPHVLHDTGWDFSHASIVVVIGCQHLNQVFVSAGEWCEAVDGTVE